MCEPVNSAQYSTHQHQHILHLSYSVLDAWCRSYTKRYGTGHLLPARVQQPSVWLDLQPSIVSHAPPLCACTPTGSELVRRGIRAMIEGGCEEVVLEAEVGNTGALRLYQALGFIRDKRLHR